MLRFSIFGFSVRVEIWFWITCLLLAGGLRPESYSSVSSLADLAIFAILAFFSILGHELGHAAVGRHFGAYPEIVLHAFGGIAVMHGSRFNRREFLLMVAAGPAASLTIGALAHLALVFLPIGSEDVLRTLLVLRAINYFWTLINLLPIQPLDGGLLLRTILGDGRLQVTATIGFVTAAGMAMLALAGGAVFLTLLMAWLAFENWRMRHP
jgi:Zn-dependent protease